MDDEENLAQQLAADYCLTYRQMYLCCQYNVLAQMDPMQFRYAGYFAKHDKIAGVTIYKALASIYVSDSQLFLEKGTLFYFSENKKHIFIHEE